ncbi:MAG: hypothetical protein COW59_04165 [Lysobacterales bacterium CG17_big_fil_post_rev_8_21_14_2_50_64_11]|nr:MAG: hypothetical protein COW59_04165 [Xanthomonadales bacterium CG17_big_fil_post_rev_8_21_14_2_50_64_11]
MVAIHAQRWPDQGCHQQGQCGCHQTGAPIHATADRHQTAKAAGIAAIMCRHSVAHDCLEALEIEHAAHQQGISLHQHHHAELGRAE